MRAVSRAASAAISASAWGPMILGHSPAGVRALERGAWFMSIAHDDAVIDRTLEAVAAAREL